MVEIEQQSIFNALCCAVKWKRESKAALNCRACLSRMTSVFGSLFCIIADNVIVHQNELTYEEWYSERGL